MGTGDRRCRRRGSGCGRLPLARPRGARAGKGVAKAINRPMRGEAHADQLNTYDIYTIFYYPLIHHVFT
uniref:Uncharacterized protein n=1 Tax=Heterorhabditis bacteriophora TaxID=37862 RepID=A0A1I7XID1_HETBA